MMASSKNKLHWVTEKKKREKKERLRYQAQYTTFNTTFKQIPVVNLCFIGIKKSNYSSTLLNLVQEMTLYQ
jgi:hypothetical protein